MPIITGSFSGNYPGITFEINTEGRLIDIVRDRFDAGVRLLEAIPQDMVAIPLGTPQRHLLVASTRFLDANGRPGTPAELSNFECIRQRLPSGVPLPWEFQRHGESFVVDINGRLSFDNSRMAALAASLDGGIAFLSEWAATPYLATGALVPLLEEWTPSYDGLHLYYPRARHQSASFAAFTTYLRKAARDHPGSP